MERSRWGHTDIIHLITGLYTPPEKKEKSLMSPRFQKAKFSFLSQESSCKHNAQYHTNIFLGFDNICYTYTRREHNVIRYEVTNLARHNEEAGTRIAFPMNYVVCMSSNVHIVGRTNDTDVLIVLPITSSNGAKPKVWLDVGLSSNSIRKFISVTKLAE